MRQSAVADQNAQSAGIQIALARLGYAVVDGCQAQGIAGAMPARSLQRQARGEGAIDVGEFIRFDVAGGFAGANEYPQLRRNLLLKDQTCASAAAITSNRGYIHGTARDL